MPTNKLSFQCSPRERLDYGVLYCSTTPKWDNQYELNAGHIFQSQKLNLDVTLYLPAIENLSGKGEKKYI